MNETARYVVALSGRSVNVSTCTSYVRDSPLLDYDENNGLGSGHPRFRHFGWLLGGEFTLFDFFSVFLASLADAFFMIPSRTPVYGAKSKLVAIALEVTHLAVRFPTAAFSRSTCLNFVGPASIPLGFVRDCLVMFGYLVSTSALLLGVALLVVYGLLYCFRTLLLFMLHHFPNMRPCGRAAGCTACLEYTWAALKITVLVPCFSIALFIGVSGVLVQITRDDAMHKASGVVLLMSLACKVGLVTFVDWGGDDGGPPISFRTLCLKHIFCCCCYRNAVVAPDVVAPLPPPVPGGVGRGGGGGWGEVGGEADGEEREGEAGDRVVVVGAANNAGAGFR
jgi:hypothetical protein